MAFVNFYLIAGGAGAADINAGSSTGAAQATTANGNWNSGTGVFIAASGTPFAATVAGDYASVYVDGSTVTPFVGKVLTVTSSTNITIDVATIKYGTAPSTSATARSCTINGAWATEQVLAAGGLATTTVPQSTKVNIKGNLTITASRTISMAGATTTPLWFSGYNTTPGDLDADTTNSLAKPLWTLNSTFQMTWSGVHQIWSGLSLVGSRSGQIISMTGNLMKVSRIRGENTSANVNAGVVSNTAGGVTCEFSWFKCPTTATGQGVMDSSGGNVARFVGCVTEGGGLAGFSTNNNLNEYADCIALNSSGSGFQTSTGRMTLVGCTVRNVVDGVKYTGAINASGGLIHGCIFSTCSGWGINNNSGTNTNAIQRSCNDFFSCTSGTETGVGDSPAFFGQTDNNDPVTSASNMTPVAGSNALNNGFPGIFENESFSSYAPIGAVTPLASGGFSGGVFGG